MIKLNPNVQYGDICTPLESFSFGELSTVTATQTHWFLNFLRAGIPSFVLENHTSFIHAQSYLDKKPRAYEDALSVCSLYMHKTPRNRETIFSMLDSKLQDLIEQSRSWVSLGDILLGLQVLILYQIIRMLDGCPRQHANSQRTLGLLDSWTILLHKRYCESSLQSEDLTYESCILLESVRRTLMVSVMVRDLAGAIQNNGLCDLVLLMGSLPVSLDCGVWKTKGKDSWQKSASSQSLVSYWEFTGLWNTGAVEVAEEDDYEKMLLVLCRHAKRTGQWGVLK